MMEEPNDELQRLLWGEFHMSGFNKQGSVVNPAFRLL